MSKNAGFTLVELLVVLVIFGFLTSLVSPSFLDFQKTQNLKLSSENLETELFSAFSQSRAAPKSVKISLEKDAQIFQKFSCDHLGANCSSDAEIFDLQSRVFVSKLEGKMPSASDFAEVLSPVNILFLPPSGDLKFIDDADADLGAEVLKITFENAANGSQKSTQIFLHSGLIEPGVLVKNNN